MFLLPTLIDCGTFIAPQCSGAWFWCAIRCGHFVVLSMTGASKPRQESAAAVCEQIFARRVELLHRSRSSQPSGKLQARTWQKLRIPSAAKRHVAHRASPRMPHPRSLPCALHTSTRAHSTLDTHAARMRASTATRTCTHTSTCTCLGRLTTDHGCLWDLAPPSPRLVRAASCGAAPASGEGKDGVRDTR